jgi:ABC-2 type transport system ATP-binding protein
MIEVQGLTKRYGTLVAVDGISFAVRPGETFGLLGPNGAGKSTTLHMLCGALRPDAGTISIESMADPTREVVRRRIGIAPQALALYEPLTAEENLAFFGRLYGLAGARLKQRVTAVLEMAGLTDRRRDPVKTYSGGMKRRLNLACALIHDPAVLFLDEPTAGVDPQARNHLLDTVAKLAAAGRTVLYTTHYMEEAQRLCDRVAVMDHGKVLALDTVEQLVAHHGGRAQVELELERAPADPTVLPGPLDGLTLRFEASNPLEEGARLLAAGMKFTVFKVERPNLETVFLALTGRRLRD